VEYVRHDERARVTNVAKVVHRDPAHVHPDLPGNQGLERLDTSRQRVVQGERYRISPV
jgi:hypothetical protein